MCSISYCGLFRSKSQEFDFLPESFLLPLQLDAFISAVNTPPTHAYSSCSRNPFLSRGPPRTSNPIETTDTLADPVLWIVKPVNASQGRGIHICAGIYSVLSLLVRTPSLDTAINTYNGRSNIDISNTYTRRFSESTSKILSPTSLVSTMTSPSPSPADELVVSRYISSPMLYRGRKIDLRIYVVVLSLHPLVVFRHREGLVRSAAKEYWEDYCYDNTCLILLFHVSLITFFRYSNSADSLSDVFVHLTNYSVNKHFEVSSGAESIKSYDMSWLGGVKCRYFYPWLHSTNTVPIAHGGLKWH